MIEPAVTPIFRVYWRVSRGATLGVRGIATDPDGRVLLIRHTYRAGWFLPGGGVESGETAVLAVTREMAEEGGVLAVSTPRLIGLYANHAAFKNDHVAVFRLEAWENCAALENGEIAERGFFALDALPDDLSKGTRRRLAEAFEGADISSDW
jgi:ADP-ribose pyrophosphatase YjhB (NUDIX family)